MTPECHWIQCGEHRIVFTVVRRDRKTLEIGVEPDTSVVVAAPRDASLRDIFSKVRKRASWVRRQQRYFSQFLPRIPERRFIAGETHHYLGRQYRLKVTAADRSRLAADRPRVATDRPRTAADKPRAAADRSRRGADQPRTADDRRRRTADQPRTASDQPSVKMIRGFIVVRSRDPGRSDLTRRLVESWYRARARAKLAERLEANLVRFPDPDSYRPRGLIVRKMRRRWGSLSSSSRLVLNRRLIEAPVDGIDYVITHELCHLTEPHHGRRFYELLNSVMPDWERRKERLERSVGGRM